MDAHPLPQEPTGAMEHEDRAGDDATAAFEGGFAELGPCATTGPTGEAPGKIFPFHDLSGELRNEIYAYLPSMKHYPLPSVAEWNRLFWTKYAISTTILLIDRKFTTEVKSYLQKIDPKPTLTVMALAPIRCLLPVMEGIAAGVKYANQTSGGTQPSTNNNNTISPLYRRFSVTMAKNRWQNVLNRDMGTSTMVDGYDETLPDQQTYWSGYSKGQFTRPSIPKKRHSPTGGHCNEEPHANDDSHWKKARQFLEAAIPDMVPSKFANLKIRVIIVPDWRSIKGFEKMNWLQVQNVIVGTALSRRYGRTLFQLPDVTIVPLDQDEHVDLIQEAVDIAKVTPGHRTIEMEDAGSEDWRILKEADWLCQGWRKKIVEPPIMSREERLRVQEQRLRMREQRRRDRQGDNSRSNV
ncbi:hypothetical protein EJ04DRAFT_567787 [Polyplosphaeria fusca]|uniref:Uncharacterized protein n=1 Tax=Polyplosphaeria fusca TaxID=682080 RepID=A0A9P4QSN5_9PLEO|nr:hypothetical protein EJ04DRAFT_567787 [Polyplosphaeria fusca]